MAGKSCSQHEPNVKTLAQIMQQYVLHRLWSLVICQHFYVVLQHKCGQPPIIHMG